MGKRHAPRHGSLQYRPRKRSPRPFARVRYQNSKGSEALSGFVGYKCGMTHILTTDNRKNAMTKGEEISIPVTIVEVPNVYVYGIRTYVRNDDGYLTANEERVVKAPKQLSRKGPYAKKNSEKQLKADNVELVRLLISTQPDLTTKGSKTASLFEMEIGGSVEDQMKYAAENLGKEISVESALKPLQMVDVHAVTKGKGFQGPVKRFGVTLRNHKSEKVKRGPGSLGAWQSNRKDRVAHAGQMGYHTRMDYNKQILVIRNPEEVQVKGGIVRYGNAKSKVLLIKGSVPGTKGRLLRITPNMRKIKDRFNQELEIEISTHSQQ